ncbi:MAG: hypothetical protein AAGN82_06245 [Myxococcota bacterium]
MDRVHQLRRAGSVFVLVVVGVAPLACGDEPAETGPDPAASSTSTAGTKNRALVDNQVKAAMKDVAPDPAATGQSQDGPPPKGIFASGEGAKALARDEKLSLIDAGAADGRRKVGTFGPKLEGVFGLQVAQSSQPGGVRPVVDYTIRLATPEKEEAAAPAASATAATAPPGPTSVRFTILKAAPAAQQPGQIPAELGKVLATVEGSRFDAQVLPNGRLVALKTTYAEKLEQAGLREFVDIARSALTLFFPPMPPEPVGTGGFWIIGDRADLKGMDMIRYRVTKLTEATDDELTFELDVRHYVADPTQVPNLVRGQGLTAQAFEGPGKGLIKRRPNQFIPTMGEVVSQMVVYLAKAEQPEQAQPVQFSLRARLAAAELKKASD